MLGLLSVFTLISASTTLEACLLVTPIPILGMFVSLRSLAKIRRESDQYTGKWLAIAGLVLSTFFLVSGVGYGYYVYRTEVPDGYKRISFETLRPDRAAGARRRCIVPPEVHGPRRQARFHQGLYPPRLGARANWYRSIPAGPR